LLLLLLLLLQGRISMCLAFFSLLVLIHRTCKWFLADEKEAAKGE
jgi:hypothetical protein